MVWVARVGRSLLALTHRLAKSNVGAIHEVGLVLSRPRLPHLLVDTQAWVSIFAGVHLTCHTLKCVRVLILVQGHSRPLSVDGGWGRDGRIRMGVGCHTFVANGSKLAMYNQRTGHQHVGFLPEGDADRALVGGALEHPMEGIADDTMLARAKLHNADRD